MQHEEEFSQLKLAEEELVQVDTAAVLLVLSVGSVDKTRLYQT